MGDMRRINDRVRAQVPVRLEDEGVDGMTLDLSPTGLFMVTDARLAAGQTIRFSIEFENSADPNGLLYLECFGEVVRVESTDGKTGVGIRIGESHLERRDRRSQAERRRSARPERRRPWDPRTPEPEQQAKVA